MTGRWVSAALVAAVLATACGSGTDDVALTTTTQPPSTSPPPTSSTTSTAPTTTLPALVDSTSTSAEEAEPALERIVFVGDSVAAQLAAALDRRSAARGGPEVAFLLAVGPGYSDQWPEPLEALVDDPRTTQIVSSFGVWLAVPPADRAAADLDDDDVLGERIDRFLLPMGYLSGYGPPRHLLLHSIDDPAADELIQRANRLIGAAADELGQPIGRTLPGGRLDGDRARVTIGDQVRPVRNGTDATHYCAAAALVMADGLLDDLGFESGPALTPDDVDALTDLHPKTFRTDGCEPIDAT